MDRGENKGLSEQGLGQCAMQWYTVESYNETDKPYENILKNYKAEMICWTTIIKES